jgi:uncharacterized protein (DUF2336 family)
MTTLELSNLLDGRDEDARLRIAGRVGQCLSIDDLPDVERRANEALARELARDAVERVRRALSDTVKYAKHLPRDIAMRIAHDVDSVACPFLEVTQVFSDSDWQQLMLTLSKGALTAVARRSPMPEGVAQALAEVGNSVVAETLIDNRATPMTRPICFTLMDRFGAQTYVLDRMAQRDDLLVEVAVRLTAKVSAAARNRLLQVYKIPELTGPLAAEAEEAALLGLIRQTPDARLPSLIQGLKRERKMTDALLLAAAREGQLVFVETALTLQTAMRAERVRSVVRHGSVTALTQLFRQARVPASKCDALWEAVMAARNKKR